MKYRYRTVLSIAGSDCSGGAGIQADLKTIASLGLYGASVVTAVTAQNTCGVRAIQAIEPCIVREQLEAVFEDLTIDAVKIGMLLNAENVHAVAEVLERFERNLPTGFAKSNDLKCFACRCSDRARRTDSRSEFAH